MRLHSTRNLAILFGVALSLGALAPAAEIKGAADTKWIEDVGGSVIKDASGRITGVNLRSSWVTDGDLRRLNDLPDLKTLDLSLTHITDQGMQELKGLQNIEDLNLRFAEYVTDEGLAALKGWRKLKRLDVHGTKASDTTIDHVSGITTLESLNMGSDMVTDIGMDRLTVLPNLKELTLGGNKIDDIGWQSLRQIPNLTYLDIGGRQGTDANIWAVKMSDGGLDAVVTLKNLRDLRFACTSVGSGLEGTKFAEVRYVSVTTEWIQKLKALPHLERLQLESCDRINDDSIKALAALPALKEVDLKGTSVTEKGAADLKAAKPNVQLYFGAWEAKAANFRNN